MHGGTSFEMKVARTESMNAKEACRNIMQALLALGSLVVYTGRVKHNSIHEAYVSTTKSMALPILCAE